MEEPQQRIALIEDGVQDRMRIIEHRILGQEGNTGIVLQHQSPTVMLLHASNDAHQRGLARAIGPDESHLLIILQTERDGLQERLRSVGLPQVFDGQDVHWDTLDDGVLHPWILTK